jgi:cysteine desulfurase
LGEALGVVTKKKAEERGRIHQLRNLLVEGIRDAIPNAVINSPLSQSSPHILSVSFPDTDGEMMLFRLNSQGVAVSMGSACTAESVEPSHVLLAMGLPRDLIHGTIRISMGYPTTIEDINIFLEILPDVVEKCRL